MDRLTELKTMPYEEYLLTPEWQVKREQAVTRADHRCQLCNTLGTLHVHHRTYENRGDEAPNDLTVLCEVCHAQFHNRLPTLESHSFHSVAHIVNEYVTTIGIEPEGIATGYADLDKLLGKLQKSDLILIGGRTRHGKTSFALNIAHNVLQAGRSVVIFSLEMREQQLVERLCAMKARINLLYLRNQMITDEGMQDFFDAIEDIASMPLWISDTVASVSSMGEQLRQLADEGQSIDLVIIDYMGLIEPEAHTKREGAEQQVRAMSRALKLLARELDIPIVVLCQLSRATENRTDKKPQLIDLRDSGSQEQDADVVLFIHREEIYDEWTDRKNMADIIVAKHRSGPTGEVTLFFQKEYTLFSDFESAKMEIETEEK